MIQLIGSIIGAMIMDKMGRLSLMRKGTIGSIIGLLLTSWALYSQQPVISRYLVCCSL